MSSPNIAYKTNTRKQLTVSYFLFSFNFKTHNMIFFSNSNCLLQILKLHMVLFKLEMIQANTKLFFTEKRNHTNKSNTIKLP